MPISSCASYIPTLDTFAAHYRHCDQVLGANPLILRLPDGTTMIQAQFGALPRTLWTLQIAVQSELINLQIARAAVDRKKTALLARLNGFNQFLDAYYQGTRFMAARPAVPGLSDGQERFSNPLGDASLLWEKLNTAPAPAGVTLPLTLADGTTQESFTAAIGDLQTAYREVRNATQAVTLARADRDQLQDHAYTAMKCFRQAVPVKLAQHPELVETLPALTPAPGHTPERVEASATLVSPGEAEIHHTASTDQDLKCYELRGSVGEDYDERDAVVLATHEPGQPLEFLTTFGLNQPGAKVSFKVFVILKTGNESGSKTVTVQRPAELAA
jgi:hypothetical protein